MLIVCGTDFHDRAKAAASVAAALAAKLGAKLLLVHAVKPRPAVVGSVGFGEVETYIGPPPRAGFVDANTLATQIEAERDRLSRFGCPTEVLFEEGDADEVLEKVARERGADLLVIGTYGELDWITEHLLDEPGIPLLTVRGDAGALEVWLRGGPDALRLLVPVELGVPESAALNLARDLAASGACELHVVHVVDSPTVPALGSFTPSISNLDASMELEESAAEAVADLLHAHGLDDAHVHLERGAPEEAIAALAASLGAQLVVSGHATGSVALSLVRRVECPVLITSDEGKALDLAPKGTPPAPELTAD